MLLGAISKRFNTITQFTAFKDFISFERKGKNKVKRIENNKIRVTSEEFKKYVETTLKYPFIAKKYNSKGVLPIRAFIGKVLL